MNGFLRPLVVLALCLATMAMSGCKVEQAAGLSLANDHPDLVGSVVCPANGEVFAPPNSISANDRSSLLFAPRNYRPGVAYPLLVSLHPFATDPFLWEAYSGLGAAASARGYWVLIPRGSDPGPRWSVPGGFPKGNDVEWLEQLVLNTTNTVCVDQKRVFVAGFSAGAAMAVGLSCHMPQRLRAIAASGGANLTTLCPTAGPVDAMILHGSEDPIAPLTGSYVIFAPPLGISIDSVIDSLIQRNRCDGAPEDIVVTSSVTDRRYRCEGHRLEYWRMAGAGHTWAGASFPLDLITGPTDHSFSATTAVLDFFDAS